MSGIVIVVVVVIVIGSRDVYRSFCRSYRHWKSVLVIIVVIIRQYCWYYVHVELDRQVYYIQDGGDDNQKSHDCQQNTGTATSTAIAAVIAIMAAMAICVAVH